MLYDLTQYNVHFHATGRVGFFFQQNKMVVFLADFKEHNFPQAQDHQGLCVTSLTDWYDIMENNAAPGKV